MDKQAQDRCHRIGQLKVVHIYRLISKLTVEENILKKSLQKRLLDEMVLKQGNFNIKSLFNKNELKKDYKGLERITFKDLDCDERMNIVSREEFLNECEIYHDKIDEENYINEMKDAHELRSDNQDHLESQI